MINKLNKSIHKSIYHFSQLPPWATLDPFTLSSKQPYQVLNLLDGKFIKGKQAKKIIDPLNGQHFITNCQASTQQIGDFVRSAKSVPKSGLHNPIKNVQRYTMYGDIFFKIAQEMRKPEVLTYLAKILQRVMPKSTFQAQGEVNVTRKFFENFSGDNARFLCKSFNVPGDHNGQASSGYRWPYGNVGLISPFNFPIQIPGLQLFGALLAGNRPTLKQASKMSICMQQFIRMAIHCGMPAQDVNMLNCSHANMEKLINQAEFRVTQFTGSSNVAQRLSQLTRGKMRIEDAGFDWKILGPDVGDIQFVTWMSDQDAYACSGQKCSAQSIIFIHENWEKAGFMQKIKNIAAKRKLDDLSVGPVITWNNKSIKNHIDSILQVPGAKVQFGGKPLQNHKIPQCYGSYQPTCMSVPLKSFAEHFKKCTIQLFGPFQIAVTYKDSQIDQVLRLCEKMDNHLTAGVVSNDVRFLDKVLGNTLNGVTYSGRRARTTGAPQNHWFGPTGDPRGAGIGTKQAILLVWTSHRQIIRDYGPIPENWKAPNPT